jgi:hypothetical protein
MDNYIGPIEAEWVDPAVELPPDDKIVPVRMRDGLLYEGYYNRRGLGLWSSSDAEYEIFPIAWLRIGGPLTADDQLRAALSRIYDEEMGDSIDKPLACHDAINRIAIRLCAVTYQHVGALLPMEDLSDLVAPEPIDIETARNNLIAEMADHGYHTEDAAAEVDGLIGVCQRDSIPRAQVQAAVEEIYGSAVPMCDDCMMYTGQVLKHCAEVIANHTGVTPTEVL